MFRNLILIFCLFLIPSPAPTHAQSSQQPSPSASQLDQKKQLDLVFCRERISAFQQAEQRGTITKAQSDECIAQELSRTSQQLGFPVTLESLFFLENPQSVITPHPTDSTAVVPKVGFLQKVAGFITLTNILSVIFAIIITVCIFVIFGDFIFTFFTNVPEFIWELGGAIFSLFLIIQKWSPVYQSYIVFLGCGLLTGVVMWSLKRHSKATVASLFLSTTLIWAIPAVFYSSTLLGFVAVIAFMCSLGFSAMAVPLVVVIGFNDDESLGRSTLVAFLMVGAYVFIRATGAGAGYLGVFLPGMIWMGSFVGYLGLLIASTRWYDGQRWVWRQVITIVAGVGALALGSILQIPELQKIGGTFFCLYLIEKPWEIPAGSVLGYAIVGLIVSLAGFFGVSYLQAHPEIFARYLFF